MRTNKRNEDKRYSLAEKNTICVKQNKVLQEVSFHLADSLNTDSKGTTYLDQVGLIPVGHHVRNLWPSTRPWCHETAGWLPQDIIDQGV